MHAARSTCFASNLHTYIIHIQYILLYVYSVQYKQCCGSGSRFFLPDPNIRISISLPPGPPMTAHYKKLHWNFRHLKFRVNCASLRLFLTFKLAFGIQTDTPHPPPLFQSPLCLIFIISYEPCIRAGSRLNYPTPPPPLKRRVNAKTTCRCASCCLARYTHVIGGSTSRFVSFICLYKRALSSPSRWMVKVQGWADVPKLFVARHSIRP